MKHLESGTQAQVKEVKNVKTASLQEMVQHYLKNRPASDTRSSAEVQQFFDAAYAKALTRNFDFSYDGKKRTLHDVTSQLLMQINY